MLIIISRFACCAAYGSGSFVAQITCYGIKVRQPVLYYHFPDGKEELLVEVIKRSRMCHLDGLNRAAGVPFCQVFSPMYQNQPQPVS